MVYIKAFLLQYAPLLDTIHSLSLHDINQCANLYSASVHIMEISASPIAFIKKTLGNELVIPFQ